jgi:streptogramin lyase
MRTRRSPHSAARLALRAARLALIALGPAIVGVARGQAVTAFPIPTANSYPALITPGPNDNLWFTEQDANQIGRITTVPLTAPRGEPVPLPASLRNPRVVAPGPGDP